MSLNKFETIWICVYNFSEANTLWKVQIMWNSAEVNAWVFEKFEVC